MTGGLRLLAVFLGFLLFGCSGGGGSREPAVKVGDPAPAFEAVTIDGKGLKLQDYKGRPLVIAFMAEWCPCSKKSAPVFREAHARYGSDVEFLVFGFQDSEARFKRFVEEHRLPFPAAYDKGDSIGGRFGVIAPPTMFFISPEGRIGRAFYGKIEEKDTLFGWIDELLKQSRDVKKAG